MRFGASLFRDDIAACFDASQTFGFGAFGSGARVDVAYLAAERKAKVTRAAA